MGVQQLWTILAPVKTHCPLEALQGQTLAVDLSMWVCEATAMKAMTGVVTRPHLRNLFFRVSHLTRMGVSLIFVVDGDPPELKYETMMKRSQDRFGGSRAGTDGQRKGLGKPKKLKRSHFKAVLKECLLLLDGLGIPHVQSKGEAEAFCALLNRENLVDGCLTDDGDAFLYGARTVYRNLTLDKKDPHVDCYKMTDIEEKLLLDRNKLVGLALLLGCDYCPKGVPGVGKELAVKVMTALGACNVLERFKVWRSEASDHTDAQCGMTSQLKGSQKRARNTSIEVTVMRKALTNPAFPDTKIINEFLVTKDTCPSLKLEWKRPRMPVLQDLNLRLLEWPEEYTLEKVLPLVTYWEMCHKQSPDQKENRLSLSPHSVVKTRTRNGVPCLEVQWYKPDDVITEGSYVTTIEPEDLFSSAFPQLVQEFRERKALKQSRKKGAKSKAKQKCTDEMTDTDSQQQGDTQEEEQAKRPAAPCVLDNSLALDFSKLSLDKCDSNTLSLDQGESAKSTTRGCKEKALPGKLNEDAVVTSQFAVSSEKVPHSHPPVFSQTDPNFSLGINDFSFMSNTDGDTSFTTNTPQSSNTTKHGKISMMGPDLNAQNDMESPASTLVMLPLMERLKLRGKRREPRVEERSSFKDVLQPMTLNTDHTAASKETSNQDGRKKLAQNDRTGGPIVKPQGSLEQVFRDEHSVETITVPVLNKATSGPLEFPLPVAGKTKQVKEKRLHSSKTTTDNVRKKQSVETEIVPELNKATGCPVELPQPVSGKTKQVKGEGLHSSKTTADNDRKKQSVETDITPVLNKATNGPVEFPQPVVGKTKQVKGKGLHSSKATANNVGKKQLVETEIAPVLNKATSGPVEFPQPVVGKTKQVKGEGFHSSKTTEDNVRKKQSVETEITPVLNKATNGPVEFPQPVAGKTKQVMGGGLHPSKTTADNVRKKQSVETEIAPVRNKATSGFVELPQPVNAGKAKQMKGGGLHSSKTTADNDRKKTLQAGNDSDSLQSRKAPMPRPVSIQDSCVTKASVFDDTRDVSAACAPSVVAEVRPASPCSSKVMEDVDSPVVTRMSLVERLKLRVGHSKGKALDAMQGKH
ncbi:PREDICTED: flap endonuclease GEN homolog 1-like [Branchiostoma belcheri]|uniref:Flap endonuclease GEN homolog 1 n=1 Tax=Branchiostoma belcheri TaxID=7741 RepID=A0A6P5ALG9_BRABE|nr:PREDICTED: flap endonuclease GEN homolog 1-like [Branchiostoma belcheri]